MELVLLLSNRSRQHASVLSLAVSSSLMPGGPLDGLKYVIEVSGGVCGEIVPRSAAVMDWEEFGLITRSLTDMKVGVLVALYSESEWNVMGL